MQHANFPVRRGQVQDFAQAEALMHSCFYDHLGWQFGESGSVLIAEALLMPRLDRELITQLMFEVFGVKGLFFQDQAVLSLYAVGKITGSVVDIGHGKIDIATVLDGQLNTSSVRRLEFGGADLTSRLAELLRRSPCEAARAAAAGHASPCSADSPPYPDPIEALKEQCCTAAPSAREYDSMLRAASSAGASTSAARPPSTSALADAPAPPTELGGPQTYTLPDGQEVTLTTEGVAATEALFRPELLGLSCPGIAESLMDAISVQYDSNYRRPALENILVCGGGSAIPGVPARILRDVKALVHPSAQPALCPVPEYLPKSTSVLAPWMGAAVLGKTLLMQSEQNNQFITAWDYDEAGPAAVHRR
jgi:actin-related protein 7